VNSASPLAGAILDAWDGTSCDVISVFLCLLTAHVRASCFLLFCTQRAVKTYSVPRFLQRSEESSLAESYISIGSACDDLRPNMYRNPLQIVSLVHLFYASKRGVIIS